MVINRSVPLQDVSGNALEDISALGALPHLLTLNADHNRLTKIKLPEVKKYIDNFYAYTRLCM